jgi:hypothetical protein
LTTASGDEQQGWRELLMAHGEQLREWAENYPPTFADKHALVSAEIARLEKRDADAMRLYEQAIHLAREYGFVQNEGLAHELAARYYLARGLETVGYAYLRSARNCYDRWGALGKVKQLDERYPHLLDERDSTSSATIGRPVGQLDVDTVVKASQAISSQIVLPKLIEKLVRIAVEHAGAERGLLHNPHFITCSGRGSACSLMMLRSGTCIRRTNMCGKSAPDPSYACPSSNKPSLLGHSTSRTT